MYGDHSDSENNNIQVSHIYVYSVQAAGMPQILRNLLKGASLGMM